MPATKLVLLLAALWIGCTTDTIPRNDAATDVGSDVDVTPDVSEIVDDADAGPEEDDIAFWADPHEVRIPCPRSADIISAVYPYIIWGENQYVYERQSGEIKALHVETGDLRVVHSYDDRYITGARFTLHPSLEVLHFLTVKAEDAVNEEGQTYRKVTYYLNRLNLVDLNVEELPVEVPFRTPACSQNPNGRVAMLQYSPETGWLTLMCDYSLSIYQPHPFQDYYRLHVETGEIQMMIDGTSARGIFSYLASDVGPETIALQGPTLSAAADAVEPFFFSVWDVSGETPGELWRLEVPWVQVAMDLHASRDGTVYYSEEGGDGFLSGMRLDRNTMQDLGMPAVNHHQYRPVRIHETLSPVISWTRAEGTLRKSEFFGAVTPPVFSVALYFWDPTNGIIRKITGENRMYFDPYLMHGQPAPRFLVYSVKVGGESYCLAYKDVIAAGILDETGHLLPEPQ